MFPLLLFSGGLLLVFWKLFKVSRNFFKTQNALSSIPGPTCTPFNGNLYLFYRKNQTLTSENFFNTLKALAQIYRIEGLFKLRLGNKFIVCVFQSKLLKNIVSSNENISKSVEYGFLNQWLGNGLLLASSKEWRTKRAMLAKAFHKGAFDKFSTIINQKVDTFLEKNINVDHHLDLSKTFQLTLEIISGALFQCEIDPKQNENYLEYIHQMTNTFTTRALNPLLWNEFLFKLSPSGRIYNSNLKKLKNITKSLIRERHSKLTASGQTEEAKDCLLDILLRTSPTLTTDSLNKVSNEVDTFLFAGHDTTALTLNWMLYLMGQYPEEQIKVRDEIRAEIESRTKTIKTSDLDRLVYLECFVKEALRLHPPVPLIGRHISKEFALSSHTIPKDVMLYVLIDQLHMESDNFESPCKFMPSRFLTNPSTLSYMPFSAGPRNCIGKRFALVLIKIVLVKLLQQYEIYSYGPSDQIETSYNIVLKPKYPLEVRLSKLDYQTFEQ